MNKTPYQRWQERTQDGKQLAAGWVSIKHAPPRRGEYEVRGSDYNYLTWAYGHWWKLPCTDFNEIPYWRLAKVPSAWKRGRECDNTGIHGADLLLKAIEMGSEEAETELCALGWKGDYRPYAKDKSWRRL